jgi:sugar phosphate isomerase/epimerase
MHSSIARRRFLAAVAASSAGLLFDRHSTAAKPVAGNAEWSPRLSLAAYSFNRHLPRGWPKPQETNSAMTLADFIEFAASLKLDAVELTSYYFPNPLDSDHILALRDQCDRLGLAVSGTAIGNDFCLPDGPDRDFHLHVTRQWIDYAAELGAPLIRIFAGQVPAGDSEGAALDRCVAGIQQSLEYAGERGIKLALENHGGITATADQLLAIVERVGPSPWFGINFDSGNFHTPDPYSDLERIAPLAINAQLKVMIAPNGTAERADWGRILDILRAANYRGDIVLEYEESEEPREAIPGLITELRSLL